MCRTNQRIRRSRQALLLRGRSRAILSADQFNVRPRCPILSISSLRTVVPIMTGVAVLALVSFLFFVVRKQRIAYWSSMTCLIVSLAICYLSVARMEEIYSRIARHESFSGKTKAYLLSQFGYPSSTKSYSLKGQYFQDWIYEIDTLGPRVRVQFGFQGDKVAAVGYAGND